MIYVSFMRKLNFNEKKIIEKYVVLMTQRVAVLLNFLFIKKSYN